jgi:preprotein translocase subunit SecG
MGFIGIFILVILVISAVLLVLVILLQNEEGEGIGGLFSGGSTTPFGSRSGNILTKFTAVLAAIFILCAFALAWINRTPSKDNVIGKAQQETLQGSGDSTWYAKSPAQTAGGGASPTEAAPSGGK